MLKARETRIRKDSEGGEGSSLMMRCALQRFQEQGEDGFHLTRRRGNLFLQIFIAAEKCEAAPACRFDFIEIFNDARRCVQRFGQRPLEGVIPEIRGDAAESLLDCRCASQDM